jgi:hypothetical protein
VPPGVGYVKSALRNPSETSKLGPVPEALAEPPKETTEFPAQKDVLVWTVDNFGHSACNRDERAARLVEEAIEIAQAEDVPLDVLQRIAVRVDSRQIGELGQEISGLGLTKLGLAENCGVDFASATIREWRRVMSRPPRMVATQAR